MHGLHPLSLKEAGCSLRGATGRESGRVEDLVKRLLPIEPPTYLLPEGTPAHAKEAHDGRHHFASYASSLVTG